MANYATNLFFATTENQRDLKRIATFLEENFNDCNFDTYKAAIDGEFYSKWTYPEKIIDEMIASLEDKTEVYIRILTHELSSEYVSFRMFSKGKWEIKL